MERVKLTFWGVRGSMATPGSKTARVGGNSACVEIRSGETLIICDAGTGIRELGLSLCQQKSPLRLSILLSHLHLDHFIGLPFFKPLYTKNELFLIGGPVRRWMTFRSDLIRVTSPPHFPLPLLESPAQLQFRSLGTKSFFIDNVRVVPSQLHHPGGALGWRFYFPNGKSLVHVSDNEPNGKTFTKKMIAWMKGADLLIHDAQYTPSEYRAKKQGWGHSPYTYPLELAAEAGVKKVFLFHHDPEHDDRTLQKLLADARRYVKSKQWKVTCDLAREGKTIFL